MSQPVPPRGDGGTESEYNWNTGAYLASCVEEFGGLQDLTPGKVMVAGMSAGVAEHVCMYPVDTIKTRMQAHAMANGSGAIYRNVGHAVAHITRQEGPMRLYRGVTAVVLAAIPSHAVHFGVYEVFKDRFGGNREGYHPVADALAGGLATMAHDAVVTPLDVVKQRLQLYNTRYLGVGHTIGRIIKEDGFRAFYASYPTTVLMNVPFMAVHFATYESLKVFIRDATGADGTAQHMFAGAGAGALGGLVSNPLDVVKTRIQTMGVAGAPTYDGLRHCAQSLLTEEGSRVFWRGTTARVLYFMPSAAISWSTYEAVKKLLSSA